MSCGFLSYSSVEEHMDCFHFLIFMNKASESIPTQILVLYPSFHFSWILYQLARGAEMKYHRLVSFNNRTLFLIVLKAENLRSKRQQVWFVLKLLSWACRWSSSHRVLTRYFLCSHILVSLCVKFPPPSFSSSLRYWELNPWVFILRYTSSPFYF